MNTSFMGQARYTYLYTKAEKDTHWKVIVGFALRGEINLGIAWMSKTESLDKNITFPGRNFKAIKNFRQ